MCVNRCYALKLPFSHKVNSEKTSVALNTDRIWYFNYIIEKTDKPAIFDEQFITTMVFCI